MVTSHAPVLQKLLDQYLIEETQEQVEKSIFPEYCGSFESVITANNMTTVIKEMNDLYMDNFNLSL